MLFGADEEAPAQFEEEIVTAEDYLDDAEEELAQRIDKNKPNADHQEAAEMEEEVDINESDIDQILEDEDGNLYIEDAQGNLIPYELPDRLKNLKMEAEEPVAEKRRRSFWAELLVIE